MFAASNLGYCLANPRSEGTWEESSLYSTFPTRRIGLDVFCWHLGVEDAWMDCVVAQSVHMH
jgi:hypothetical protein